MDLLKSIKEKINFFSDTDNYLGLQSVITHIEVAERHLNMGKKGDDHYFTDVIYRTNQAFEGSLKEAYILLAGSNAENKTPYQIEKYLEQENFLKGRVLSLFSNYRLEWRNKSTHDYRLYFNSQEALLAIISICAFFLVLLDQMIEAKAYSQEKEKLKQFQGLSSSSYSEQSLLDQIIELLINFSKDVTSKLAKENEPSELLEREILGMLAAYLNVTAPELEVLPEYQFRLGSRRMIADFLIKKDSDSLIIEIKKSNRRIEGLTGSARDQLVTYMFASDISKGVLFVPPASGNQEVVVEKMELRKSGSVATIVGIYSKNMTINESSRM